MPGTRITSQCALHCALGLLAGTAGALVLSAPAIATPISPCEEVVYVGVCIPVGGHQSPPVSHPHAEFSVTPDTSSNANAIG